MEVKLIDKMGDDLRVVDAARVSFSKESWWDENNDLFIQDQKLIKYLAKHNHWTPFSHVVITMRERVPIFVARQRFKHMVGFSYNEVSRRYVDDPPEFFVPDVWRGRPINAKQGSSDEVIERLKSPDDGLNDKTTGAIASKAYKVLIDYCAAVYENMIESGVAPEQARMVLPQSMFTEYYVTGSLAAWARAYKLRSDPHAQLEIQELARMWNGIISELPELKYSWEALTNEL